ncbi:hypothetical protein L2E82_02275 [Cichorium intybus]|uniref:Uncharacterized protein n=1 Tax=Cichorium intybus TaxID=13427 RepID=A0ACB9H200_CICIN|nr:hypothetical protein L2E82_02275 [Cichorium intybus]
MLDSLHILVDPTIGRRRRLERLSHLLQCLPLGFLLLAVFPILADSWVSRRWILENCSHEENISSSSSESDQEPPQEAVLKAISGTILYS